MTFLQAGYPAWSLEYAVCKHQMFTICKKVKFHLLSADSQNRIIIWTAIVTAALAWFACGGGQLLFQKRGRIASG